MRETGQTRPLTPPGQARMARGPNWVNDEYSGILRQRARMRKLAVAKRQAMLNDPYRATPDQNLITRSQQEVYDPYNRMIDAVSTALTGKAALASDQQRSRGSALAAALAPYAGRISGTFNAAAGSVGQDTSRIAGGMTAQGNQLGAELGGKLAGAQAPGQAVEQFAGGAVQTGQGAAGAINALGSAEQQRLRGEGQAHSSFAGALPGIEQLKTLRELGLIKEGLSAELLDTIGDLQVKAAGAYGSTLQDYRGREDDKKEARYKRTMSANEARAAAKKAKDDERKEMRDRQWEAAVLKQAYQMPLTPREKALINRYGSDPDAVNVVGKAKIDRQKDTRKNTNEAKDDARDAANAAAKDARKAANDRANDARKAENDRRNDERTAANNAVKDANKVVLEAKKAAARSGLEKDKAAYRRALERQKSAQRRRENAQKAKLKPPSKSGKTSADSILGG